MCRPGHRSRARAEAGERFAWRVSNLPGPKDPAYLTAIRNPQSPILNPQSERLSDAEVNPPTPRFGLAVHGQSRNAVQLITEVEADRADRCLVAKARADGVPEIAELDAP